MKEKQFVTIRKEYDLTSDSVQQRES